MKLGNVILLCENQHRYRAEKFLKNIKDIYFNFRTILGRRNSGLTIRDIEKKLPIVNIYNNLVVDRNIDGDHISKLFVPQNYQFWIPHHELFLTDDEIIDIKKNGTFEDIRQFDQQMNDLGIEGKSIVYVDDGICGIDIGYIKDDVVKVITDIVRHNTLDGKLRNNLDVCDRICDILEKELPEIIRKSNQSVIQFCDVTVFNKNDFRKIVIDIGIVYKFFNYKDWRNCKLPNKYDYEPTIYSSGGEDFIECIGKIIQRGLNVPSKIVTKRLNDKEVVLMIEILRSDLRGKELFFDEGVL